MSDNVQVAVRLRPLIEREKLKNERELWKVKDGKYIFQKSSPSEQFCFDRVFGPMEENFAVYEDLCLPIVESVMQGFNGTIFAYGQTSSGKTYTMMGEHNGISNGVVQYSITDVFKHIQKMPDREFLLRVSFLEIYNEKVYDLLSDKNEDLKLLEDSYGTVKVNGLLEKIVQREDQIWDWMHKAQNKRRTGATIMNRNSSRSHSIFRMIIESRVKDQDAAVVNVSQLNLVDLAGSESLKQTNAKEERFKEGVHINLSLSILTRIIKQLSLKKESERDDHFINYRESKLTRLLQNSLGGNALTAIICAVTPASVKETLSTINFAKSAKEIKNKPTVNEIFNEQALLKQYVNQIKKLSQELQVSKDQGKELAEKTKQNENLKRQIEALKANFVSETGIAKSNRRETWGGHLAARRMQLEHFAPIYQTSSTVDLSNIDEDAEGEQEASDCNQSSTSRKRKSSCLSLRASVSRKILNVETQTDFDEAMDCEELVKMVKDLKYELNYLQNELNELQDYTTLEKQSLKAENELQKENEILKNYRDSLVKHLEELKSKYRSCSCSSTSEETFLKDCQASPLKLESNNDSLNEPSKMLEQCNQDARSKIIELEASVREQKEAFEIAQSKWNSKMQLIIKELESKHEIEMENINYQLKDSKDKLNDLVSLQEKYRALEECNKQLRQKLSDLEMAHSSEMKVAEEKNKAAEFELQTVTEALQTREKELAAIKALFKESDISNLEDIKTLRSKYYELEESNSNLKQDLNDLKSAHCIELKEAEAKCERAYSELSTVTKDLEAKQKELIEAQNKLNAVTKQGLEDEIFLQEKCSKLVQYNIDLRKKITDLENYYSEELEKSEENFKTERAEWETERAEWETETLKKFKDLEANHQKELTDLETRVGEKYIAAIDERIHVYVNEACELREEVKHLKLSNAELLSTTQDQSNKIKELEKLIQEQIDEIINLGREKDKAELAMMEKYENIITEYKSRQRQCRDINRQLRNQVSFYKEEVERIKGEIKAMNACNAQALKEIAELTEERDNLIDKNKIAKQEIHDLKMSLKKTKMDLDEQIKGANLACKTEELKQKCEVLSFELDQRKAKIISLESNNTRLIQEIKKLSSRHVPCKREVEVQTDSDCGLKVENEKWDGKIETKVEENRAKKLSNDNASPKDNDVKGYKLVADAPADMIRYYRLEGLTVKQNKQLKRLEKENSELKSELLTMKARPLFFDEKTEKKVRNPDLKRVPMSPLQDKNEDFTVTSHTTPTQLHGAMPKTFGKHVNIRERYKKINDDAPKTVNIKSKELQSAEVKENIKRPLTEEEFIKFMTQEEFDVPPDCKTQ